MNGKLVDMAVSEDEHTSLEMTVTHGHRFIYEHKHEHEREKVAPLHNLKWPSGLL